MIKSFKLKTVFSFVIVLSISHSDAFAFRPVGHVMLQKYIAYRLPAGNIFKVAMDSFPVFAAWGAVGPDLAYVPLVNENSGGFRRKWALSKNFADFAHYYKTDSFCRALIEEAIRSNDKQLIAFAAGWLTHVAGDFGSHGIFVAPEAGYYLRVDKDKKTLHGLLEQYSESALFIEVGKMLPDSAFYTESNLKGKVIFKSFFDLRSGWLNADEKDKVIRKNYLKVEDLLERSFTNLYNEHLYLDLAIQMGNYDLALGKEYNFFGYGILPLKTAQAELQKNNRNKLLGEAFDSAVNYGIEWLTSCIENKFVAFRNTWNLDVGPNTHTLVVKTVVGNRLANGSNINLYIDLTLDSVFYSKHPINYKLPIVGGARFKKGDVLYSYIYIENPDFNIAKSNFKIYMLKGPKDRAVLQSVQLIYNGKIIFTSNKEFELRSSTPEQVFYLNNPGTP